jgi:tRNA(Ile)-lysidine synthase
VHKLAQAVLAYIEKNALLRPGDRVAAAVSGGADSVSLLRLLIELRGELGIVLSVVHLNHRLRGEESDQDEQFVLELAASHGLPLVSESCGVKQHAAQHKMSLEAAAREIRYEFFGKCLRDGPLDKIATAHTLDDQAETVLLKLARGAGTRGLAGIYPIVAVSHQPSAISKNQAPSYIVRPLLSTSRKALEAYLSEIDQDWREDSSNRDLRHTRNRIRHGILPRFERHVNPAVRRALSEAADIARAEEDYWADEIGKILPAVWNRTGETGSLNSKRLNELPLAARRRLLRTAANSLGLRLEFSHVEETLALENEGACSALPEGWVAVRHAGEVCFHHAHAAPSDYKYDLAVPGKVVVAEAGIVIEALAVAGTSGSEKYNPEHLLDANSITRGLTVRNWKAGERFWPAHTKEPRKIKDLLQDRHITGEDKKQWPVVASGDEVVWVRGLGTRRDFQPKHGEGILICESPIPG